MWLLVLLLALSATACGSRERDAATVRFWNGFTGPDGRTMLRLVKRFNEENPDVRVVMQRMDWYTYYNKLFVAGLGSRAPELFVVHSENIPRFMQAEFVRPVDDLLEGPGAIDTAEFWQPAWESVAYDGRHFGIPLDVGCMGMYYNKALFREAGIVDARGEAKPPRTREEFLDSIRKLTRDTDGDGRIDQWGFVFTNLRTNAMSIMRQFGGEFFTPEGDRCTLDDEANVAALAWCRALIEEGLAPSPENFDAWIGLRQGSVAMAFEGVYMLADLDKQADLDYGAAPVPRIGHRPAAWTSSHILCFRRDLVEKELDAAMRFVRYLSDNTLDWAEGGQVPVRASQRDTDRFRAMPVPSAFAEQLDYLFYSPRVPFTGEFDTEFNAAVESALRGSRSPEEALAIATRNVNEAARRYRETLADAEKARGGQRP